MMNEFYNVNLIVVGRALFKESSKKLSKVGHTPNYFKFGQNRNFQGWVPSLYSTE